MHVYVCMCCVHATKHVYVCEPGVCVCEPGVCVCVCAPVYMYVCVLCILRTKQIQGVN